MDGGTGRYPVAAGAFSSHEPSKTLVVQSTAPAPNAQIATRMHLYFRSTMWAIW